MTSRPPAIVVAGTLLALLLPGPSALAQRITDTSDGTLSIVVPFGQLTPGTMQTPSSVEVQFRLRSAGLNGYRLTASVSFTNSLSAIVGGGATLSPSDVGVGITSVAAAAGALTPRTDTIATGFAYDPGAVSATNGLTPYGGAAAGRATLQDIVNTPGMTVLSGPTIALTDAVGSDNFLTVTMRFGVQRQLFTPGSMSAAMTLTIVDRPLT